MKLQCRRNSSDTCVVMRKQISGHHIISHICSGVNTSLFLVLDMHEIFALNVQQTIINDSKIEVIISKWKTTRNIYIYNLKLCNYNTWNMWDGTGATMRFFPDTTIHEIDHLFIIAQLKILILPKVFATN